MGEAYRKKLAPSLGCSKIEYAAQGSNCVNRKRTSQ